MTYKSQAKPRPIDAEGRELAICHNCRGPYRPLSEFSVEKRNGREYLYCPVCTKRRKRMRLAKAAKPYASQENPPNTEESKL